MVIALVIPFGLEDTGPLSVARTPTGMSSVLTRRQARTVSQRLGLSRCLNLAPRYLHAARRSGRAERTEVCSLWYIAAKWYATMPMLQATGQRPSETTRNPCSSKGLADRR